MDNQKAIEGYEIMREKGDAQIYFAPPYPYWERGLRKNTNGRFRQSFPKNRNLKNLAWRAVGSIENELNYRLGKRLLFKNTKVCLLEGKFNKQLII